MLHGPVVKGMRRIIIETDEGTRHEYSVPRSVHVNVQEGERVRAGDPLIDGPIDPHDVLAVLGIKELQRYLVDKIQEVYRSQSVAINDKHIEVICRQMLQSVRVTRVGDTDFPRRRAGRSLPLHGGERSHEPRRRAGNGTPRLRGITKASLSRDSFISAASFPGDQASTDGSRHRRPSPSPPPQHLRHRHAERPRDLAGEGLLTGVTAPASRTTALMRRMIAAPAG